MVQKLEYQKELRVLVVDDDEVDVMNVQRAFRKIEGKYALERASDGFEAIQYLETCSQLPQIILLDINMPRMDGLEFLGVLRNNEKLKSITVFVISTSDSPSDLEIAYNYNVAGYILKPLSSEKFSMAIERLVKLWGICEFP